jgi:hypothetical protein
MKRFLFATLLVLVAFVFMAQAQTTTNEIRKESQYYQYKMEGNLDSLNKSPYYDSLWTKELQLGDYDGANTLYYYRAKFTPTAGNPKYSVEYFVSDDNITYSKVDTIIHQSTNNGVVWGTFTPYIKAPYVKLCIFQVALGRDNAAFKFEMWLPQADERRK